MKKILAIDDNNDKLMSLGVIIKDSFPETIFDTALSGKKGIELAISKNPDVILLGTNLPDMDGFEVCRRLKLDEQLCDIPVVFLTALKEDKENRIKALEVGGEAFLNKPIDETELVAQIRAMVKIKEFANHKRTENERLSRLIAERTRELVQSHAETLELINELKAENETRRKIENELRESEEKYRLLHEYAGVGIGYYTPEGTIISYNKVAALNMNGKPEDFAGKSIYSLFPKDNADFYMDRIKKALNSESRQEYEDIVELPKEVRWFHSVFTRILDSDYKVAGVQIISTDITERKKAEIALNISESRLKRAELASGLGNWELHLDSKTFFVSEGAVRIYGIADGEIEMQIIQDIPLPEFRQTLDLALKNLIEKDQLYRVEFKIRKEDTGEIRDIQSEAYFDQEKRVVFGIIQDITERVKRDEALSDSNELLSRFVSHSPIYTFIKEVTPNESRVLKASENFIDMIGVAGSQMIGKNMHELFPPEFADKITADDWEVASNDHLIQLDEELNGRYYITIKYPIKQGNKTLLAGYTIDITERKEAEKALLESEQRYRQIFDNSLDAFLLTSPDGAIQSVNPAACQMFGRTQEEICNLGRSAIIDISDPRLNLALEERARTGKFSGELIGLRCNGTKFSIELSSTIFADQNGDLRTSMIIHDISERKHTEELLIESEANARAIMEATEDVLILMDKEGIIIDCNEVHAQRLSTTRKELLGKNVFDRLPPDVAESRRKNIHEAIYSGKPVYGEDFRGGFYNEFSIYPIFVQNKITDRVAIFARDITARKHFEEELRNTKEYLENLLNYANAPIIVWDNNLRITQFNKAFELLTGRKESEVLGKLVEILFPAETRIQSLEYIKKTSTGERWDVVEIEIQDLKNQVHTLLWNSAAIYSPDGNAVLATIAQGQDITKRKLVEKALLESETRFRSLLQNVSSVSVQGYSFDGNTQYWNMASEQLYGYKSNEAIGRNLLDLIIPPEMKDGVKEAISQMIETGKPIPPAELSLMRKDGSRVPVYSSHAIVHTLEGVPELFCIDIDLTEQKQAEATLKENEARLRELIATKDKFFSIISHDLKNPFNSILGLSNLLVEQIQEKNFDGIEEYAAIIQKSSMQAFALLVNLLEWSRSQTGRMEFSPEYVEMVSLINEVVELFDDSVRQKSINICKELPRNLLVFADKAMISTVLRNLISNAIKFTHTQGQIMISAETKKDRVIIAISDNGVGIKKDKIEKLFRIGETQTTLGTKNEKGTGLGLILCREFIEKHGGKIWVESETGKGSKFYIEIPKT